MIQPLSGRALGSVPTVALSSRPGAIVGFRGLLSRGIMPRACFSRAGRAFGRPERSWLGLQGRYKGRRNFTGKLLTVETGLEPAGCWLDRIESPAPSKGQPPKRKRSRQRPNQTADRDSGPSDSGPGGSRAGALAPPGVSPARVLSGGTMRAEGSGAKRSRRRRASEYKGGRGIPAGPTRRGEGGAVRGSLHCDKQPPHCIHIEVPREVRANAVERSIASASVRE